MGKKMEFYKSGQTPAEARKKLEEGNKELQDAKKKLVEKTSLCTTFEFPELVKQAAIDMEEQEHDYTEVAKVWDVIDNLQQFIESAKSIKWSEMDTGALEDESKSGEDCKESSQVY